jgi:SPP1 family predicted phage head-tail adaptor
MGFDPLYIAAGELRHSITIQSETSTADSAGQPVAAWSNVLTTRAKVEGAGSAAYKASFSDNVRTSDSSEMFTIRWPGIDVIVEPGQRISFAGDLYEIQAVDNVMHRNRKVRIATKIVDEDSN